MEKNLTLLCLQRESIRKILLRMKLLTFIILVFVSAVSAEIGYSQPDLSASSTDSVTVSQVFKAIEKQSEYIVVYNERTFDVNRKVQLVDLAAFAEGIEPVLEQLSSAARCSYVISGRQIVICEPEPIQPISLSIVNPVQAAEVQQYIISGTVTDQQGLPVAGVTVSVKGTTLGALTGIDGKYIIPNAPRDAILVFSFIGMIPQEIQANGRAAIDIVMDEATLSLEEVVVIGYGVQKKATVTGSVSAVQTQALVQSPQANIANALVGRMTGLLSVQREGQPGGDQATLRIRGAGTFTGSTDPLIMVDGVESLNYNNIDPNEIDNVSILKDASATAVYGVRGANGVLLITTKRGAKGKPVLSLSSNTAITSFTDVRENLGSYEWSKTFNDALRNNSYFTGTYTPMFSESDIEHYKTGDSPILYPNTNWISLMMKPASSQSQNNVNISGGNDLIKYFVNAGYFDQKGLFNNTKSADDFDAQMTYKRYNFRSNFDFNITKRFSANINISSQTEVRTGPNVRVTYIIDRIYNAPPNMSPGIIDGKVINVYDVFGGNPLEQLLGNGLSKQLSNYLTSSVRLNYDLDFITKGLALHGTMSYWNYMINTKNYSKAVQTYKPVLLPDNTFLFAPQKEEAPFGFGESTGKNRKAYMEFGLNYSRQFGSSNFTGLLLYNQSKLFDPGLSYVVPNGYQGLVGRVTYDYDKRYLVEFNAGYNGTENFAPGRRFGFFPAYSLGWVASEESFFPKNQVFTYLKIRGSYGEVGNDKIGGNRFLYNPSSYLYSGSLAFGVPGSTYQTYPAAVEGIIGNPFLVWERAKKSNIGMDMSLWKSKIKIIADYFVENRDNILATPGTTPEIVGVTLPAQNLGKMRNSGYEAEVNFNDKAGKVNYWVKLNYTFTRNMIVYQDEVKRPFTYQNRTGQAYGQPFGLVVEGFYNTWEEVNDANRPRSSWQNNRIMPGDFKYKDVNGDGILNSDDQVPIGYSNFPEVSYGISFGGDYKGFDFSVLFQGVDNVTRPTYITSVRPFENNQSCQSYIPELAWTQEKYESGAEIKLPKLSAQQVQVHNFQGSTFITQDSKYLRLKNAEIGYSLKAAFLSKLSIQSLRVYANGINLITWHGLYPGDDPEQVSGGGDWGPYPNTRTINFGFNIKF
jgi:TonB-linked SusC/RagA family outer membrane protein